MWRELKRRKAEREDGRFQSSDYWSASGGDTMERSVFDDRPRAGEEDEKEGRRRVRMAMGSRCDSKRAPTTRGIK